MSNVDKEEIIITEEGLDEALHNAYLKGRNDVLDKIKAEIEQTAIDYDKFEDYTDDVPLDGKTIKCSNITRI